MPFSMYFLLAQHAIGDHVAIAKVTTSRNLSADLDICRQIQLSRCRSLNVDIRICLSRYADLVLIGRRVEVLGRHNSGLETKGDNVLIFHFPEPVPRAPDATGLFDPRTEVGLRGSAGSMLASLHPPSLSLSIQPETLVHHLRKLERTC